ncbi:unnamed protein product, partial [marine sediment metagenome]
LVVHDPSGMPVNLQMTQPGTFEPVVEGGRIAGYKLLTATGSRTLRPIDVVRIWEPDPYELFTSRGVMVRNATKLNMESHALKHWEKFYENDATPNLALESDAGEFPGPADQESIAASWRQKFNRRFGRMKLAPAWIMPGWKIKVLNSQGDASAGVAMLEQTSRQTLESYRVSPTLLGRNQDVNRAAAETARFTFDQNTIEPRTRQIADALTAQLASQYEQPNDDARIVVKYKPFIARDKDFDLRQEEVDLR